MISHIPSEAKVAVMPSRAMPASRPVVLRTAGMLMRRPDLSDEAILAAIAERLRFEGRDPAHAAGVLKAALAGRKVAVAFLRKLVLPAPQAALQMPIQPLLRERAERTRLASWFGLASSGR